MVLLCNVYGRQIAVCRAWLLLAVATSSASRLLSSLQSSTEIGRQSLTEATDLSFTRLQQSVSQWPAEEKLVLTAQQHRQRQRARERREENSWLQTTFYRQLATCFTIIAHSRNYHPLRRIRPFFGCPRAAAWHTGTLLKLKLTYALSIASLLPTTTTTPQHDTVSWLLVLNLHNQRIDSQRTADMKSVTFWRWVLRHQCNFKEHSFFSLFGMSRWVTMCSRSGIRQLGQRTIVQQLLVEEHLKFTWEKFTTQDVFAAFDAAKQTLITVVFRMFLCATSLQVNLK